MQEAIRDALVWMLGFGIVTIVYLTVGLTLIRRWRRRQRSAQQPAPPPPSDEPAPAETTNDASASAS